MKRFVKFLCGTNRIRLRLSNIICTVEQLEEKRLLIYYLGTKEPYMMLLDSPEAREVLDYVDGVVDRVNI